MTNTFHRTIAAKSAPTTTARRTAAGMAVFACAAGALTATVTPAEATVTGLNVTPAASYAVNTAYTLTATCDRQTPVNFTDNGQPAGTAQPDGTGTATLQWVPSSPGMHTIVADGCSTADQAYSNAQISVNVGGIGTGVGTTGIPTTGTQTTDPNAPGYYNPWVTTTPAPAGVQTTDPNAPGYYNPYVTTTSTEPNSMIESALGAVLAQVLQGLSSAMQSQTQGN